MSGNDWLKGYDPLGRIGQGNPAGGGTSGLDLGFKIFSTVSKSIANSRAKRLADREQLDERARQAQIVRDPPKLHGSARWATGDDIQEAGLLGGSDAIDHPSSLLLGAVTNAGGSGLAGHLSWDGEGHLLAVAPTRSGKSTTLIVPNLLRYRGSCIVLDPKGELYRDTACWRAANVGPVYRIAPFSGTTDSFNPLDSVRSLSDARALADLMLPEGSKEHDFFRKEAVAFLSALILFVKEKAPAGRRDLAEVRLMTAAPIDMFLDILKGMATCGIAPVQNAASVVLSKSRDRGLPNLRDTLNADLAIWDDPGVSAATSEGTVDFHALKDRPATVYITVPFDKTAAFAPFLKVLLTASLEAMVQNDRIPDIPVLFVLDEFLSLGPFSRFRDAIRTHAGAGVRLWFFLQNLSMLEEHYPTSWKGFFDASVKVFFGTDEHFTGGLVSDYLGDTTVAYLNITASHSHSVSTGSPFEKDANRSSSLSHSVAVTGRALVTANEVVQRLSATLQDGSRYGFVFLRGVPPVEVRLIPWFKGSRLTERAALRKD